MCVVHVHFYGAMEKYEGQSYKLYSQGSLKASPNLQVWTVSLQGVVTSCCIGELVPENTLIYVCPALHIMFGMITSSHSQLSAGELFKKDQ